MVCVVILHFIDITIVIKYIIVIKIKMVSVAMKCDLFRQSQTTKN